MMKSYVCKIMMGILWVEKAARGSRGHKPV